MVLGIDVGKIAADIRHAVREDTAEINERLNDIYVEMRRTNELLEQLVENTRPT